MIKNMLFRGLNSFMYSVAITLSVYGILIGTGAHQGEFPMLPEYMAHFSTPTMALIVQCLLIGAASATFGLGSFIMENEKIGLITQSIIYFVATAAVWVPVACFCWGFHKYLPTMIGVSVSYLISYFISWRIQYKVCRTNIEEINQKLQEMGQS